MAVTGTRVLVGRYVLREVLGTGGMATVWRARDEVLSRDVAVKVLNQQFAADPGFAARFEREARHAAGLSHPRLVTVFDCGVDGSTPFIVMELVAGPTLRQVLDRAGTLPLGEAVRIAAAVCEALEVAHAAGLVHRDIKPANIVLAGSEVKVLDFGIARVDGGTGVTGTAVLLGTAAYLSPEQASGRPAGPQADLYALGCVLMCLITGRLAFDREGYLYASSRAEGCVYRISPEGAISTYAEGMGIATGLAFDRAGNLYVGDRSGTIFKIAPTREIFVFATLEPSMAAYHLAFRDDGVLLVTAPTTSSNQPIYAIAQDGTTSVFYRGLGRPQGMAFDAAGNLYVAASLGGRRGVVRITPETEAELFLSGPAIVGLAFSPSKSLILATNNSLYRVDVGIEGRRIP